LKFWDQNSHLLYKALRAVATRSLLDMIDGQFLRERELGLRN